MFSIPLFQYEIENWQIKKNQLKEVYHQSNIKENIRSRVFTDYHEQFESGFKYNAQIQNILKDEIDRFEYETNSELKSYNVTSSWFELALNNHFHAIHSHGTIGYSSVCFIEFDSSVHTETIFVAPFNNFITAEDLKFTPNASEGTIIFFPSIIKHYTVPNNSSKERLILSFNMH
jgi:hypothetical protein